MEYFMSNKTLDLPDHYISQQIDLSRRLLHMSLLGCPRPDPESCHMSEALAMRALIIAFSALAKTSAENAELAINLLQLTEQELHHKRERLQSGDTKFSSLSIF